MTISSENSRGRICTFYSYKGGVGRSMALANVAVLLCQGGAKVLMVDWDLEAPGIERYFEDMTPGVDAEVRAKDGIVEIVGKMNGERGIHWRDSVIRLAVPGADRSLDFLSAGKRDPGYVARLQNLDWETLFLERDLGNRLEIMRDEWLDEYDHILIDSRTGITDIGGICTIYLPDAIVAMFSANHQSVDGVADVISRARRARSQLPVDRGALVCVPVPARDETRTEYGQSLEWRGIYRDLFSEFYLDFLPKDVTAEDALDLLRIPNIPFWSFGERLPVLTESTSDPNGIAYYYRILARLLATDLSWHDSAKPQDSPPGNAVKVVRVRESQHADNAQINIAKRSWSPARVTVIAAVIGGIFAVIGALVPSLLLFNRAAPATPPPSSAAGRFAPTIPAQTLNAPGSTAVFGVAFSPSGILAAGDLNGSSYLWSVTHAQVTAALHIPSGEGVYGVAFSPDGSILAASTVNRTFSKGGVVLWDTSARGLITVLNDPDGRGVGAPVAFSPDGRALAAADANGDVYLWNTATRKLTETLRDPNGQEDFSLAFSPSTGFLAAADGNGTAYIWDTKEAKIVLIFRDPDSRGVNGVAFSPDGSILATGDRNGNIYLWNVATGARTAVLHGPAGTVVNSVAFSPRTGILADTAGNGEPAKSAICVWDTTGKLLATLRDPATVSVTRLAFSPDGSTLAVGDENGNAYIWNMTWAAGG